MLGFVLSAKEIKKSKKPTLIIKPNIYSFSLNCLGRLIIDYASLIQTIRSRYACTWFGQHLIIQSGVRQKNRNRSRYFEQNGS